MNATHTVADSTLSFLTAAREHPDRVALTVGGTSYRYRDLLDASERIARYLLRGRPDLEEARVVLIVPPGFAYVAAQWGVWRAGGVVVPLALAHPVRELVSLIKDADPQLVFLHPSTEMHAIPAADACGVHWAQIEDALTEITFDTSPLPSIPDSRRAHIVYTSGTTGKPKGVVTTHANTRYQVASIGGAWEIGERDTVLNALPLHHVHGIVNALLCPLWYGATVDILPRFDADEVWKRFERMRVTVFMGVPTMYVRLIRAWEEASPERQKMLASRAGCMRVMISGSAALPRHVHRRWREITGQGILERYGLTETGMVLSNPLRGHRAEGHVGRPLPLVGVRLRGDEGFDAIPGEQGTIEVKGWGVFSEYWRRPEETAAAFHEDGWFRTGDRAVLHREDGYRILGRESVDIIKTGGEKVSALEIEDVLRRHPRVADCAVVGIPEDEWGEQVCAAVVLTSEGPLDAGSLRAFVKEYLAGYKAPARIMGVEDLPRNSMGKVLKEQVRNLFLGYRAVP